MKINTVKTKRAFVIITAALITASLFWGWFTLFGFSFYSSLALAFFISLLQNQVIPWIERGLSKRFNNKP